jgi:hypothetical protein
MAILFRAAILFFLEVELSDTASDNLEEVYFLACSQKKHIELIAMIRVHRAILPNSSVLGM